MLEEVPITNTTLPFPFPCQLGAWCVAVGSKVHKGSLLCSCVQSVGVQGVGGGEGGKEEETTTLQIKSGVVGIVRELMYSPGDIVQPGSVMVKVEERCQHDIVVFDMCADCGLNLRKQHTISGSAPAANIMAIHDNAGIRISPEEAAVLAHKDKLRLLKTRKLTLVVDLDQTLIHTSTDPHIEPGLPDVYGFRLAGQPIVYHCRLRPHAREFLDKVSKLYELHVFTMATKDYAAAVIDILDPNKHLFCDRIITRHEFFDPRSKALRFKSVFPCGDSMVAIIDDREDVWGRCPNLVHVKPYVFFSGTTDINAPPPLVPTSESPSSSSPSSSLPSTPTTPRPFFGGTTQGSGVVPQGQPRPFKKRHMLKQHRHPQRPPRPQSELPSQSHTAESRNNGTPDQLREQQQPPSTDSTQDHSEVHETSNVMDDVNVCSTNDNGLTVHNVHQEQIITHSSNVNNNNNKRKSDDDGSESGGSASGEEEGGEGTGGGDEEGGGEGDTQGQGEGEGDTPGQGEGEGDTPGQREGKGESGGRRLKGGGKGNESSSSSSGSSSDSEDSSSSGSSSAMDDTAPQESKATSEVKSGVDTELPISAEEGKEEQDTNATNEDTEVTDTGTEQKKKKSTIEIEDSDSFLVYLGDVLERIHSTFYTEFSKMVDGNDIAAMTDIPTPDLKSIIPEMRQSLLKGAKILFTGVIPTNIPPQRSPIWNTARAFGAVVHDKLVPGLASTNPRTAMKATTHVIAGKSGTAKLKEAKRVMGVKIVNPRWLWSCAEQWKWLDEKQFPVEADEVYSKEGKKEGGKEKLVEDVRESKSTAHSSTDDVVKEKCSKTNQQKCAENKPGRNSRLDSRISVSDEELERMEAEVEAEIGSSGSSSSDGEESLQEGLLGVKRSVEKTSNDSLGYGQFTTDNVMDCSAKSESRKRKHVEVDDSSRSNSPHSNSEPHNHSDSSSDDDDDDDVLAALLEEDNATHI